MSILGIFILKIVKNRHSGVFMLTIKRHEKILSIIQERKTVTSKELQKLVYVSHSTIIRDLTELEKMGLIKRIHGGASIVVPKDIESSFNIRVKTNVNEKTLITKAATRFIEDGYNIHSNTKVIVGGVFKSISSLKSIVIPNGIRSIGNSAFDLCNNLVSVEIPESVTFIGYDAFRDCSKLTEIILPSGITSINRLSFAWAGGLTSIVIPDGVTYLDYGAFCGCLKLKSVIIPASVQNIGEQAFVRCDVLENVYFMGSAEMWDLITIEIKNDPLTNANLYYYSETKPSTEGSFWHYVNGIPTIW